VEGKVEIISSCFHIYLELKSGQIEFEYIYPNLNFHQLSDTVLIFENTFCAILP